jgi:hypothetical protein
MKILTAIDVPALKPGWGREQQWCLTGVGTMLRLLGSRIEFRQTEGSLIGDGGASLRWKFEAEPVDKPADEAA